MPGKIVPAVAVDLAKDEIPDCAFCQTAMKPERVGAGRYLCPVCSRITIIP
jgi:hypothetical protein